MRAGIRASLTHHRPTALASNVMASVPRKRDLLRRRNGRRVHRQLQMPQDFLDDASLHNRRDDP
jgi:hypothetical protein